MRRPRIPPGLPAECGSIDVHAAVAHDLAALGASEERPSPPAPPKAAPQTRTIIMPQPTATIRHIQDGVTLAKEGDGDKAAKTQALVSAAETA